MFFFSTSVACIIMRTLRKRNTNEVKDSVTFLQTNISWSYHSSTHARETTQKSVSLMANPRDLATVTMYRYTKYWFVKDITESFTSFVLFSSTF